ncbi:hypothetical protein GN956_G18666 [Arapaima gigas]
MKWLCVALALLRCSSSQGGGKLLKKYIKGKRTQFLPELSAENSSVSLKIQNITESAVGLFYCVTWSEREKQDGRGYLLFSDEVRPSPPSPQGSGEQRWVLLAAACPVCVLVAAASLVACVRLRRRAQEGAGEDGRDVGVEEEDAGLHYAALDIPTRCKRMKTSQVQDQSSTYSAVKHM